MFINIVMLVNNMMQWAECMICYQESATDLVYYICWWHKTVVYFQKKVFVVLKKLFVMLSGHNGVKIMQI